MPPGDARPVHRGDDRLVDVEVAQHRFGAGAEAGAVVGARWPAGEQRDVVAEVAAGAERVVDAGDDRHPRVGVVAEPLPRVGQRVEVLEVECVAPGRAVDGDGDDVSRRLRSTVASSEIGMAADRYRPTLTA